MAAEAPERWVIATVLFGLRCGLIDYVRRPNVGWGRHQANRRGME
jgi:hypothetical protein